MQKALFLLAVIGVLGAVDTLYFHEWRARLPAQGSAARAELQLHAARDFVYAILFGTLPRFQWMGWWAAALLLLLAAEVVLTMWDFVVEDWIRKPLGGVYPAERVMHALIGIIYGAMLVYLLPQLLIWWQAPAALAAADHAAPLALRLLLSIMAVGVFTSGARDVLASLEVAGSAWPWKLTRINGADDRT